MKKLLGVMFIALLIAVLLPVVASAEIVDSGTCGKDGNNLTWTLDDEGKLTISGTGAMKDYDYLNYAPWKGETVKNAVIEDGVTSIGSYAFYGCSSLTSVSIPDGVTSIGDMAFCDCNSLTSISIPEGVTSIGINAFQNCSNLISITIPDSVTSIGDSAFVDCSARRYANMDSDGAKALSKAWYSFRVPETNYDLIYLYENNTITGIEISNVDKDAVSIIIPDRVTSIGEYAFYNCGGLTSVSIPDSVTDIGRYAFEGCTNLARVDYYGANFYNAKAIIEKNNDPLKNAAWYYHGVCGDNLTCVMDEAGTLTISGTGEMYDFNYSSYNNKEAAPWRECEFKNVVIEAGVISIGNQAFMDSSLKSVTIPETVEAIGDSAFSSCQYLGIVSIPESVKSIGKGAFYQCENLDNLTINEGVTNIGESAFLNCYKLKNVVIPGSVTIIGNYAFQYCDNLESVTINEGVTSIGNYAFQDCYNLNVVKIPDSLTSVGFEVFPKDVDVIFYANLNGKGAKVLSERGYYFRIPGTNYNLRFFSDGLELNGVDKDATTVTIPDNVTTIGKTAFSGCKNLNTITIPDNITEIRETAFDDCDAIRYAKLDAEGAKALSRVGYSFRSQSHNCDLIYVYSNGNIKGLSVVVADKDATVVTIPDGVTRISDEAFYGCKLLERVTIPNSIKSIDANTFYGCYNLKNITISEGVTTIMSEAFSGCSGLESITIPNGVTSIGPNVFNGCKSLQSITISENVTGIDNSAFEGCKATIYATLDTPGVKALSKAGYSFRIADSNCDLKYDVNASGNTAGLAIVGADNDATVVTIPDGVTRIGEGAFDSCSSLTSVHIPEGVISIGEYAFAKTAITSIVIPETVTIIGDSAFYGCPLESIIIPNSVTNIGNGVFACCDSLMSIRIPESVKSIGSSAFHGCSGLTDIRIPDGVTSIGESAFYGCGSLTDITIPDGVTSIDYKVFYNCSGLTSISIPDNVNDIGGEAFCGCSSLTGITIPDSVTSIGSKAFDNCPSLTLTVFHNSQAEYYAKGHGISYIYPEFEIAHGILYKYNGNSGNVIIPDGVTSIGDEAFRGCSSLTSITIPEGVTNIGDWAFSDCSSLTSVTIPEGVTSIGGSAFRGCSSLTSVSIPEGVTSIGVDVFYSCDKLTKVVLPASVESIGTDALPWREEDNPIFIYCYEFTYAESWAKRNSHMGYTIVYLDGGITDDMRSLTLPDALPCLACGDSRQLVANVFPAIDVGPITWTSSNPAVASVENGLVTALTPGKTTITATMGTLSDSVEVTTYIRATSFAIPEEVWFVAKDSAILPVTNVQPKGSEVSLTWSSDNTSVQISNTGVVSGNIADKDAIITATTDNGISRQCLAHVCYPVTAVAFSEHQVTMREIDRVQLTANVTARTRSLVNKLVTFTSADESVAKVDENGRVTAMGPGTTTVTATAASGVSDSITVTVQGTLSLLRLPAGLEVIEDEAFMNLTCEAVIIPEGCTTIGARAFANCKALAYVRIPASVQTIAEDAFEGCDKVVIDRAD